jgi:hypothetical protein
MSTRPPEYGLEFLFAFPAIGSSFRRQPPASDHWHRTEDDPGRPYQFKDVETLIEDFFNAVERVLSQRGIGTTVVAEEERRRLK